MRFIETKKLNDYILNTGSFLEDEIVGDFSSRLDALEEVSLQGFSIENDRKFLREVSTVLNVIVSIIYHPHISNKREEVVIRIEQAQQIGQEAFLNTLKDSKLWKDHGAKMIPEEVYYYQHIDELRIYENRFIGFLVDIIDKELAKFSTFYLSRLPVMNSLESKLESSQVGAVIVEIDRLRKKTQFIKNTYFYREVSKGKPISHKIQPTNILLKDRLYRYCFKFYKSFVRYEDMGAAKRDLRSYYMILMFKELRRMGFELKEQNGGDYLFEGEEYSLTLKKEKEDSLALTVKCHDLPDAPAKHLIGFHVETERQIFDASLNGAGYDGAEMLSIWELSYADSATRSSVQRATEAELVRSLLESKMSRTVADKTIYRRYCPVCGKRGVDANEGVYTCSSCASSYMFDESGEETRVWFRKIRKWGIS